jgi:hypothetical protein
MKYAFYIIYNVLYQIFSFWLLLLVGTYYNEVLISDCLFWKSQQERAIIAGFEPIKIFTLLVEAAILILIIYIINQLILSDTEEKPRRVSIANRTAKINLIASLVFLMLMTFGN